MSNEQLKTVKSVHQYILDQGWTQTNGKPPSWEAIRKANAAKHFIRRKNGHFHPEDIEAYCQRTFSNPAVETLSIKDAIEKEKLRKLKIENDRKMGELVLLSEEVKRRVAVIQGMKTGLLNGKAAFMRRLRTSMKERHQDDTQILTDLLADVADFYEDLVLSIFDDIGAKGKL